MLLHISYVTQEVPNRKTLGVLGIGSRCQKDLRTSFVDTYVPARFAFGEITQNLLILRYSLTFSDFSLPQFKIELHSKEIIQVLCTYS